LIGGQAVSDTSAAKMDGVMQLVLDLRAELRKEKNFAMSDKIRDTLNELGITVKDTPDGSTWTLE
jgi:cysteinyl-tRNA synthetase